MPNYTDPQTFELVKAMSSAPNKTPDPPTTKHARRKSSTAFPSMEDRRKFSSDADDEMSPDFHRDPGKEKASVLVSPVSDHFPDILKRRENKVNFSKPARQDLDDHDSGIEMLESQTQRSSLGPEQSVLGSPFRKRRLSTPEPSSSQPQKKVRFSPVHAIQRPAASDPRPRLALVDYYCGLLAHLQRRPQALSLTDISACFRTLQVRTEIFSKEWFGDSADFLFNFKLHELQEKHPALFCIIQYVLDASTTTGKENHGWREFFENPRLRPHLVYAILGEWFVQHIFKHTAFGISYSAQQQISETIDKAFLHHDAIVRSKARSGLLKQYWRSENPAMIKECLDAATFALADDLSIVLEPLMTQQTLGMFDIFLADLKGLILNCAGLHLSMLITGANGTVFMYPGGVTNGTVFHPGHDHFTCVNLSPTEQTKRSTEPGELLLVKMTCWARIEAYVPHGADMVEMSEMEQDLVQRTMHGKEERLGRCLTEKEITKVEDTFDWSHSDEGRNFWQPLPRELWADAQAKIEKQDMMAKSAAIRKIIDRKTRSKASINVSDTSSLSDGDFELDFAESHNLDEESTDQDDENEVMRGPYTTIYHCICPHVVYCEWTSKDLIVNAVNSYKTKKGAKPQSLRQINSLAAAVAQARSELQGYAFHKASFEDLSHKIWNSYARNSLYIEWGVFLFAVLSSLTISLSHKQGLLYEVLKSSASSVALTTNTVKKLLKTGSSLLIDHAKLSETFEQAVQANYLVRENLIKAFAQAFNSIRPRSLLTAATSQSRLMLTRETTPYSFASLGRDVFGSLTGVFSMPGPTVAQPEGESPAFPILTREATIRDRTMR